MLAADNLCTIYVWGDFVHFVFSSVDVYADALFKEEKEEIYSFYGHSDYHSLFDTEQLLYCAGSDGVRPSSKDYK